MKKLTEYLEEIGQEIHDASFADTDGVLRPIMKDELLAREIWKRALGYEEESQNADGTVSHRVFQPDPKAQAFIFERREGKFITPPEGKGATLLDKISALTKMKLNLDAEEIVNGDSDDNKTDA